MKRLRLYSVPVYFIVLFLFIFFSGCKSNTKPEKSNRPNIVFIMADDLGYHDLGCYGQEKIMTPNIDRLAEQGMRFTDFYAGAAVCAPSRACLQTGLHTGHVTVRGNQCRAGGLRKAPGLQGKEGSMRIGIPETEPTLGTILSKAGYHTGIFGKWHLSGYLYENLPVNRGYDVFKGSSLADPGSSRRGFMFHNDSVVAVPAEYQTLPGDERWTRLAIDFIRENKERPFIVMINLSTPHKPFRINDQGIYTDSSWNEITKNYAALVSRMDNHVGLVVDALKEMDLEDNTLLIFCSDNGGEYRETPEEWAGWTNTIQSNKPLKGGKADFYEGGIRVPFIARWPGIIEAGTVSGQPVYFPDILPTFADIANTETPELCDGVSMLDVLKGEGSVPEDRFLYWEFEHRGFHQVLRHGEWVMLRYLKYQQRIYGQSGPDNRRRSDKYPFFELYNLENDISQEVNLIEEHPEIANEMLEYMKTARVDNPYYPLKEQEQYMLDSLNKVVFE